MDNVNPGKRKILIVEDNNLIREMYSLLFSGEFETHDLVSAESVAEAKKMIIDNGPKSFDVAVVDGSLPDGTAVDVVNYLSCYGFLGGVVIVTGGFKESLPVDFFHCISAVFKKTEYPNEALFAQMHYCIEQTVRRLKDD